MHAGEVDRANQHAAARPVDSVLETERNKSDLVARSSSTISLVPSPSVSRAAAPTNLGRVAAGVVLILDVPVAVGVKRDSARIGILCDDHGRAVRFIRLTPAGATLESGPRLPVNGRGGPPFSPRINSGDP